MSPGLDGLLVGVVTSPVRVEARVVEWTPFGRLRVARRRLVEDVMAPSGFVAPPVQRQLARVCQAPGEEQAAESWVQSVASSVEQLLFGLRGSSVRIGLALDGWLDGRGHSVLAARGGPRVEGFPDRLTNTLRARGVPLRDPVRSIASLEAAAALGEIWSPLGAVAGGAGGLVTCWDTEASWAEVAGGRVVREGRELPGGPSDLGLAALSAGWRSQAGGTVELKQALGRRDPRATAWVAEAARGLGKASGRRLLERLQRTTDQPPGPGAHGGVEGLVVTGALGELLSAGLFGGSMDSGLVLRLSEREDASMLAGWIERDGERLVPCEGLVRRGQGARGLVVGAAASGLLDRLPADAPPSPSGGLE